MKKWSLLIIILLVFASCGTNAMTGSGPEFPSASESAESSPEESFASVGSQNAAAETSTVSAIPARTHGDTDKIKKLSVMDAFIAVLKSDVVFYKYTVVYEDEDYPYKVKEIKGKYTLLSELLDYWSGEEHLNWKVNKFTIVDMDGDGVPEVVTEVSMGGERLVFHYENGEIYSFSFVYRGMNLLKKDGTFLSSGGAGCTHFYKLKFIDGIYQEIEIASFCDGIDRINSKPASEDEILSFFDKQYEKEDVEWHPYSEKTIAKDFAAAWRKIK